MTSGSGSKLKYREYCFLSSIMKCNFACEQATHEKDNIAQQQWLLLTPRILSVVHPLKRIPVIPPKKYRKLLMVLSRGHYLPVNRDNMGNTTEFSPQYFRVITNVPQFDYPYRSFQKPRVVRAGLNACRRRRQQLPLTVGSRKPKTVYKNKCECRISLVDANSTMNACCP